MKTIFTILSFTVFLVACSTSPTSEQTDNNSGAENTTEHLTPESSSNTIDSEMVNEGDGDILQTEEQKGWIVGVVESIQTGKDGYTAKLKATDGKTYMATIGYANLTDKNSYKVMAPGDSLLVKGEVDGEDITVREMK